MMLRMKLVAGAEQHLARLSASLRCAMVRGFLVQCRSDRMFI